MRANNHLREFFTRAQIAVILFCSLSSTEIFGQWNLISGGYNYSGNIGIGSTMTSLSGALHVNGLNASGWSYFSGNVNGAGNPLNVQGLTFGWNRSAGAGESLIVYNTSLGGYPRLTFNSFNGAAFTEEMTLVGGKLGIGTNTPQENLHVLGNNQETVLRIENSNNNLTTIASVKFKNGSSPSIWQTFARNGDFFVGIANVADYLTIKNGGNVGLGTSNPLTKLHVAGAAGITPSVLIQNDSYNSTNSSGSVAVQFGFANHSAAKIEAFKQTVNTTGLNFYTEYGYNVSQFAMSIAATGNVGIGTTTPDAKLSVKGQVHAQEVKVDLNGAVAPDYVFEPTYNLSPLDSIKTYIDKNKHLPEVPSAKEMEKKGVNLGEMNMLLLKKVEELTLYVIELKNEVNQLRQNQSTKK